MKTLFYSLLILGLSIWLDSCKKHGDAVPPPPPAPNVYVLGVQNGVPLYWKNAVQTILPSATGTGSFSVAGNNVYTVGSTATPFVSPSIAEYWKNGTVTQMTDSNYNAEATAVFVSGNDVYVAGAKYNPFSSRAPYTTPTAAYPENGMHATWWKNGVVTTLPSINFLGGDSGYYSHAYEDYISSIFVSGTDVYIAGGSLWVAGHAEYWKNGALTNLTNGLIDPTNTNSDYPTSTAVFASGNDVYVTGFETSNGQITALYWKNGAYNYLSSDRLSGSSANSVYVSGSDLYIAGFENVNGFSSATLWKNGVPTHLTSKTEASSYATSVYVSGNDVYVAGYTWNIGGYYIATYWKNGVATHLTDGSMNAIANSIIVR